MAKRNFLGSGAKIFVLLLLVLVLSIGAILWFDYLGLVKSRNIIAPLLKLVGYSDKTELPGAEDPLLLAKERIASREEAVALKEEELSQTATELSQKQAENEQISEQLKEKEKLLEDKEKLLNERENRFVNRRVNIEQNAQYLVGMEPQRAVNILLAMEDMDIIDILRATEEIAQASGKQSIVSYWLSLMPAERGAALTRKMSKKPAE